MAEMLSELPENHPDRARILKGYKLMMVVAAEVPGQGRHVARAHRQRRCVAGELFSSAMFTFAMITGVKTWLARRRHLRPRRSQGMDRRRRLRRPEPRRHPGLRGHRQEGLARVLLPAQAPHRRLPRPGPGPLGRLRPPPRRKVTPTQPTQIRVPHDHRGLIAVIVGFLSSPILNCHPELAEGSCGCFLPNSPPASPPHQSPAPPPAPSPTPASAPTVPPPP